MGKIPWLWVIGSLAVGAVIAPKLIAWSGGRLPQVGR